LARKGKKSIHSYQNTFRSALGDSIGPAHFIDAGVTGTGYATWLKMPKQRPARPDDVGCISASPSRSWADRAAYITTRLAEDVFDNHGSALVVIEQPTLWSGSAKSQAAAEGGNLGKMMFLIGMIAQVLQQDGINLLLVTPNEWKGSMPKSVVITRIKRVLKGWSPRSHAADAVGMGLSALGML